MTDNFAHQPVAGDDVAFNDFSQALEVVVVADDESASDCGTRLLVSLNDVDVDVVVLPELPSERDAVLAPCRRSEEEITSFEQIQLRDGAS